MKLDPRFDHSRFIFRRKFFTFLGAKFHIYDQNWNLLMFSKQKAFKLREDIRIYTDESMTKELLTIKARQIVDFSATYDIVDATTNETVGAYRRKGLSSIIRDHWLIFDAREREVGEVIEDSTAMALVRRLLTNLVPQKYSLNIGQTEAATFHQHFNPFILKYTLDIHEGRIDPRLAIGAGVLLCAIEGRQG